MKRFLLIFLLSVWRLQAGVLIESPYTSVTNFATVGIHIHSLVSPTPDPPGNHSLSDIAKFFGDTNGFGGYIITEHDVWSTNSIPPFAAGVFIQGQEITRSNHTIGMFLTNLVVGGYGNESGNTPQGVVNDIVAQGGIAGLAHPNYTAAGWTTNLLWATTNYQYLEIINTAIYEVSGTSQSNAESKWDWLLTLGRRVWGYAALDTHIPLHINGVNEVFLTTTNESNIKAGLLAGNMVFGNNHRMRVTSTNNIIYADSYGISSTFEWIISGPSITKTTAAAISDSYTCTGTEGYVRLRCTKTSDALAISYSQPLWITPTHLRLRKTLGGISRRR